jgi:Chitin synthase N-terminal
MAALDPVEPPTFNLDVPGKGKAPVRSTDRGQEKHGSGTAIPDDLLRPIDDVGGQTPTELRLPRTYTSGGPTKNDPLSSMHSDFGKSRTNSPPQAPTWEPVSPTMWAPVSPTMDRNPNSLLPRIPSASKNIYFKYRASEGERPKFIALISINPTTKIQDIMTELKSIYKLEENSYITFEDRHGNGLKPNYESLRDEGTVLFRISQMDSTTESNISPQDTIQLFNGIASIESPVPRYILDQIQHGEPAGRESTHEWYTAVTCYPTVFAFNKYKLRPKVFARPRPIELMIAIDAYTNQGDLEGYQAYHEIAQCYQSVIGEVGRFNSKSDFSHTGVATKSWQGIVVVILMDSDTLVANRLWLQRMGLGTTEPARKPVQWVADSGAKSNIFDEGNRHSSRIFGKDVIARLYEVCTPTRQSIGLVFSGSPTYTS